MTPSISPPPSDFDPPPQWIITRGGNGAYVLKNVANEKYLGVEGEPRAGAKLVGVNFLMPWKIDPEDPGSFWYR